MLSKLADRPIYGALHQYGLPHGTIDHGKDVETGGWGVRCLKPVYIARIQVHEIVHRGERSELEFEAVTAPFIGIITPLGGQIRGFGETRDVHVKVIECAEVGTLVQEATQHRGDVLIIRLEQPPGRHIAKEWVSDADFGAVVRVGEVCGAELSRVQNAEKARL